MQFRSTAICKLYLALCKQQMKTPLALVNLNAHAWNSFLANDAALGCEVLVSSDCLTVTAQGVGMLTVITLSFIC